MTDEKNICGDCKDGEHCENDGDDECGCKCTFEDNNEDEVEEPEFVDEIDEDYLADNIDDVADDHLSYNKSGSGITVTLFVIISIIVVVAFLYDGDFLWFISIPFNDLIQPDNPIVIESPIQTNSDVINDFIPECNLMILTENGRITSGRLNCPNPPTNEQIIVAEAKFQALYGNIP